MTTREKAGTPFDVKPGQPSLHLREWTDEEKRAFCRWIQQSMEMHNLLRKSQESKNG